MPNRSPMYARAALMFVGFGIAFGQGVALADVPSEYPETCTIEQMVARGGGQCEECSGAYHGDRDACTRKMKDTNLVHACKTQGASVWTEIWCEKAPGDMPVPETKSRLGCSVAPTTQAVSAALAGSGLALAVLLGLRRRRVNPRA